MTCLQVYPPDVLEDLLLLEDLPFDVLEDLLFQMYFRIFWPDVLEFYLSEVLEDTTLQMCSKTFTSDVLEDLPFSCA